MCFDEFLIIHLSVKVAYSAVSYYILFTWNVHFPFLSSERPSFATSPQSAYHININGSVELPCTASGNPRPAVQWTKVREPHKSETKISHFLDLPDLRVKTNKNQKQMKPHMQKFKDGINAQSTKGTYHPVS